MGVGFLSAYTVGLEFGAGRLVILDVRGFPVLRSWFVVRLRRKWLPPVATAFREFLLTEGEKAVAGLMAHRGRSPARSARR